MLGMSAALSGLVSGGINLLGGLGAREREKDAYNAERQALTGLNKQNIYWTTRMNEELRQRADSAARTPHITTTTHDNQQGGGFDAAGFLASMKKIGMNPISAARAGLANMFATAWDKGTQVVTETGHFAMEAALAGQYLPSLVSDFPGSPFPRSGLEVASQAAGAGWDRFTQVYDQGVQNQFQRETLMASLLARGQGYLPTGSRNGMSGKLTAGVIGGQSGGGGGELATSKNPLKQWCSRSLGTCIAIPDNLPNPGADDNPLRAILGDTADTVTMADNALAIYLHNNPGAQANIKRLIQAGKLTVNTINDVARVIELLQVIPEAMGVGGDPAHPLGVPIPQTPGPAGTNDPLLNEGTTLPYLYRGSLAQVRQAWRFPQYRSNFKTNR